MRLENPDSLEIGVEKFTTRGLIKAIAAAPVGDLWPSQGVKRFGMMVEVRGQQIRVDKIAAGVSPGEKVWVHKNAIGLGDLE